MLYFTAQTESGKAVNIVDIIYYPILSEFRFMFKVGSANGEWDTSIEGDIYGDEQFISDVREWAKSKNIDKFNSIDYTEQGMQSDNYVSIEANDSLTKQDLLFEVVNFGSKDFADTIKVLVKLIMNIRKPSTNPNVQDIFNKLSVELDYNYFTGYDGQEISDDIVVIKNQFSEGDSWLAPYGTIDNYESWFGRLIGELNSYYEYVILFQHESKIGPGYRNEIIDWQF